MIRLYNHLSLFLFFEIFTSFPGSSAVLKVDKFKQLRRRAVRRKDAVQYVSRDMQSADSTKSPSSSPSTASRMIRIVSEFRSNRDASLIFCLNVHPRKYRFGNRYYFYINTKPCGTHRFQKFYVDEFGQIRSKFRSREGNDKCLMQRRNYLVLQCCEFGPDNKQVSQSSIGLPLLTADGENAATFPGERPWSNIDIRMQAPDDNRIGQKWILEDI